MKNDSLIKTLFYQIANIIIPDSLFVKLKFRKAFGRWPNLKSPKSFNEKLTWLKLNDHNPLYTQMVDKYEAKKYVASLIGEEYIIPTYGVWDKAEDIDFDSLPDKFVLKATHDSGRVIICRDKSKLDRDWARAEMKKSLRRNFYAVTREWPYKNVKRRIIAEKLLEIPDGGELADIQVDKLFILIRNSKFQDRNSRDINDYKFFCFNGHVKFMKVDIDRSSNHCANYYDRNFRLLDFWESDFPRSNKSLTRPQTFETMVKFAELIAQNKAFIRVDFYEINGHPYFGEATFYPASGTGRFSPSEADNKIGQLLKLPG